MEEVLRVTPVVGLPQSTGWSQVVEHRLDGNRQLVVELAVGGENASNIGREMIDHVLQQPPKSAQGLFQAAEELIAKANHLKCEVSFVLSFFRRLRVTVVTYQSRVVLKRGNKIGALIQSADELGVVEGKYQIDDIFIFATEDAEEFLSEIKINLEKGYDEEGVVSAVVPAVHAQNDSSKSALAFVSITPGLESNDDNQDRKIAINVGTKSDGEVALDVEIGSEKKPEEAKEKTAETTDSVNQPTKSSPSNKAKKIWRPISQLQALGVLIASLLSSSWKIIANIPSVTKRIFSSNTYVGAAQSKRSMNRMIIGAVIAALLFGLIGFFVLQSRSRQEQTATVIDPFYSEIAQIEVLSNSDPILARQEMSDLIEQIKTRQLAAQESGNNWMARQLETVQADAEASFENISGIDVVPELPIFFDLRMVDSDYIATQADRVENQLVTIDAEQQQLVGIDLGSKEVTQIDISEIGLVRSVAADLTQDDQAVLLLANGIFSNQLNNDAQPVEVEAEGDSNREATLIDSYNSYAYVFNPEKRNIYRYISEQDGFSDPVGWLIDPLGIPFDQVSDWAIDGEIWIVSSSGEIKRFRSGREVEFEVSGMENPLSSSLQIITNEDMDYLYLMEPGQSRVVILSKEGEFIREVSNQSIGAATSFIVNNDETTAYLISGSTIFELEL